MAHELTLPEAEKLVETFLNRDGNPQQIVIVPGKTLTYDFGYVVECQPRRVLEGGDPVKFGVPGVGPIIVDKVSRKIYEAGAVPKKAAIDAFMKNRNAGKKR